MTWIKLKIWQRAKRQELGSATNQESRKQADSHLSRLLFSPYFSPFLSWCRRIGFDRAKLTTTKNKTKPKNPTIATASGTICRDWKQLRELGSPRASWSVGWCAEVRGEACAGAGKGRWAVESGFIWQRIFCVRFLFVASSSSSFPSVLSFSSAWHFSSFALCGFN